ncbi:MAG: aminotransferase class I/II-fold pyridoxal phosphate-dependent enzyme [Myxococcota bacterium]
MGDQERRLLLDAFDSNWIAPIGPHVDAFEREMCDRVGAEAAAALSSGTAALHLALVLAGVGRGDHVWCSSLTFAATANAITYVGATPTFIDSDKASWNLDPDLLAEALREASARGALPRAVIAVDLYGQCADYDRISACCEEHGVRLISDAAEALGATYRGRAAGTLGHTSVFSFNGNKIITTSGGGMLLSEDRDLVAEARKLASQARDPAPHYQHSRVGFNYRMSNLLAALGRGQLRVLDERVEARRANNAWYRSVLEGEAGVSFMPEADYGRATFWLTCIVIEPGSFGGTSEELRTHLESLNIEARPIWKPMHRQPVFADCRMIGGRVADHLFDYGLCLPSGSSLSPADRTRIEEGLRAFPRKATRRVP